MIQLLILLLFTFVASICINKKAHELLPITFISTILMVYFLGIILSYLRISNALRISAVMALSILIVLSLIGIISLFRKGSFDKQLIITPQILVCFVTCIAFFIVFSTHKVMHWDDLSYWAIYTKDLFFLNRIPFGVENCTVQYKDYTPIIQIMQYFFMFNKAAFNETAMFQINCCFMYILMLPFLDKLNFSAGRIKSSIAAILFYIVFPHVFTTQFYYKLGVDYLMGLLFGYGLYWIVKKESSFIKLYSLSVIASFLILVKTSGIILVLFLSIIYMVINANDSVELSKSFFKIKGAAYKCLGVTATFLIPLSFYLSWKLWGRRTGNHGYLSDKVSSNIKGLSHLFPDYSIDVTLNYIKHFFTYPLTRERFGITAAVMVAIIIIMYYVRKKVCPADLKRDRTMMVMLIAGLVMFCVGHLYMYLFVFDDWEAYGLLEFDRYINQYLAGALYYYLFNIIDDTKGLVQLYRSNKAVRFINPTTVVLLLFAILLPYPSIKQYLLISEYNKLYASNYYGMRKAALNEWHECGLNSSLPLDEDHRIMMLANAWDDQYQYFVYEMCPQAVTVAENLPALESGRVADFTRDLINMNGIEYIYVLRDGPEVYQGDFYEESKELREDHQPLEAGTAYEVYRSGDNIMLKTYLDLGN